MFREEPVLYVDKDGGLECSEKSEIICNANGDKQIVKDHFVRRTGIDNAGSPEVKIAALSLSSLRAGDKGILGAGIRVKQIQLNTSNLSTATNYSYNSTNDNTSGVTSYEPLASDVPVSVLEGFNPESFNISDFKSLLRENFNKLLGLTRDIPPPGITHGKVTVEEEVNGKKVPGKMVYEFQTFDASMIDRLSPKVEGDKQYPMTLRDFTLRTGLLKSATNYGANDIMLNKTEYHYLHDYTADNDNYREVLTAEYKNQGVVTEAFNEFKTIDNTDEKISLSRREKYPVVLVSTKVTEGKTGIVNQTWNVAHDFYSGAVVQSLFKDSYGNFTLTETTPAYKVPTYAPMMKQRLFGGKNMLTQGAASTTYLVSPPDNLGPPFYTSPMQRLGLVNAMVQTWGSGIPVLGENGEVITQQDIPRKQAVYNWDGKAKINENGSYPIDDFQQSPFSFDIAGSNPLWEKRSEILLVDINSHVLEAKDVNGNNVSTKFDINHERAVATAIHAKYDEIAYSGAEYFEGNDFQDNKIDRLDGAVSTVRSHTGQSSLLVKPENRGFHYLLDKDKTDLTKTYHASVWFFAPGDAETQSGLDKIKLMVVSEGKTIASTNAVVQQNKSKSWYLLEVDFKAENPQKEVEIYVENKSVRAVYFDDFRVHPINASMTSYVYDKFSGELTHVLDNNNLYSAFEYDASGRLIRTKKEIFYVVDKTISESKLNYKRNSEADE